MKKLQTVKNKNPKMRGGFFSIELMMVLAIAAMVLAVVFLYIVPTIKANQAANELKTEFTSIVNGAEQYYSDKGVYPASSNWAWTPDNAYVPQNVIAKGWKYQCSSNTMIIDTPSINNPRVLTKMYNFLSTQAQKYNGTAGKNGNSLEIRIPDKPCETTTK
jgi:type II secretory pathway pseudopilin PulG